MAPVAPPLDRDPRPRRRRRGLGALVLVASALAAWPAPAAANDDERIAYRPLALVEDGHDLRVTGAFADAFDGRLLERLSSGFATTVVLRAYVYPRGGRRPLSFAAATYRVVYDLWEEVYLVEIHDPRGRRALRRATRAEALKDVTTVADFPVARAGAVPEGPHFFIAFVVEVNPVSQELLGDVRRWLTRAHDRDEIAGGSFFGSFVSVFVNPRLDQAERIVRFRSQYFYRVKR